MTDRESEAPVGPGDVLAGKYKVERVLGMGGMGVVVQALHLELDERVAVKFLLPKSIENPEMAARFVREARAAVRIKSEHVVRVSDVGRLDDGAPYIVMEYLEGKDLSALIGEGAVAVEDAVDYVLQACVAMAEAHRLGIVHRDLKPSNLFLTHRSDGSPVVKVLDFGISKVSAGDTSEAGLTKTATPMGSPYYMSPEQLRSAKDVNLRTDVWALGVILFELLTLMPPFQAESMPQLVAAILSEPPMSLEKLAPSLPAELRAIVDRCLEKDRERRYPDIAALAQALAPFAPARSRHLTERLARGAGGDRSGSAAAATASPRAASPRATPSADERTRTADAMAAGTNTAWIGAEDETASPNRKRVVALGGVAALAAVAGLGFFAAGRGGDAAAPSATGSRGLATESAPAPGTVTPVVVPEPDTPRTASAPPAASVAPTVPSVVPVLPVEPVGPASSASATSTASRLAPARPAKAPPPITTGPKPKPVPMPGPAPTPPPGTAAPPPPTAAPAPPAESPKPRKNPLAVELK